jgi:hypothetical protein
MANRTSVSLATAITLLIFAAPVAAEQQSENHVIEGATIHSGLTSAGIDLSSTGFRITFSAMGEPLASNATSVAAGLAVQSGFVSAYSPPSEVTDLVFADSEILAWRGARSGVSYVLYRGSLAGLPAAYGSCIQTDIPTTTTDEPSTPAGGEAYVYLVAAKNSLNEEGGTGSDSTLSPRTPTACP